MAIKLGVPFSPIGFGPDVFGTVKFGNGDARWRTVGIDREDGAELAVVAFGKERHSLGVEGSCKMIVTNSFEVVGGGYGDLNIVGAKREAAERGVENVMRVANLGDA